MSFESIVSANNERAAADLMRQLDSGQVYVEKELVQRVVESQAESMEALVSKFSDLEAACGALVEHLPKNQQADALTKLITGLKIEFEHAVRLYDIDHDLY